MTKNVLKKILLPTLAVIIISLITTVSIISLRKQPDFVIVQPSDPGIVNFDDVIQIRFNNFTPDENLEVNFYPELQNSFVIKDDLIIIESEFFNPGEKYTLQLSNSNSILFSQILNVKNLNDFSDEEIQRYSTFMITSQADTDNQWIQNLPFFSQNFSLFYDFENFVIRIRIYNSEKLDEKGIELIQQDAVTKMSELDIPSTEKIAFILD